jgi:hypothetical protein
MGAVARWLVLIVAQCTKMEFFLLRAQIPDRLVFYFLTLNLNGLRNVEKSMSF